MSKFKRFLCAALAALILFYSPGFAPKAEAVALVDDASIITAALLMATFGGITFAQSNHAVSSIQKFLAAKAPALDAATKLAASIISDTGKLLITKDVESAFSDFLPSLVDYYTCVNGSTTGSTSGSFTLGVSSTIPHYATWPAAKSVCIFPCSSDYSISLTVETTSGIRVYNSTDISPTFIRFESDSDFLIVALT